jgi:hypothetical protein
MRETNERPACHRAEDLVTFLYNEASAADARDFADHAAQCDACGAELAVFREVHDSILTWRNEALGSVSIATQPAAVSPGRVAVPAQPTEARQRLSALAALREFFGVSPLWLRATTAFAALLLCGLVLFVVSRSLRQPAPVARNAADEKLYTQKQLEDAVNKKLSEREAQTTAIATTNGNEKAAEAPVSPQPSRNAVAKNSAPRHSPRVPALTLAEREQLAADLRLIPGREEAELPFVFSDEPDQR